MSTRALSIAKGALRSSRTTGNSIVDREDSLPTSSKPRLLICDRAVSTDAALVSQGYDIIACTLSAHIPSLVRNLLSSSDIVLLDLTTRGHDVLATIAELMSTIGICNLRPRVFCYSTVHRNPHFALEVERCGARYCRVGNSMMLIEAIDLLLVEMNELQRSGPCFQIIHRFSQGSCAPGEEVSAALLVNHGEFFQLPLAMVERLVFDFLAHHRRIALDSLQIVAGLSGDWFYRDHAANSGHKQVKRIRRATVKVLIQRIRKAMASTLARAGLRLDPYDVLRSCPAEGTNRVLYKLHGDVRWVHEPR